MSVRSKARFVDPIVNVVIGPAIRLFDLCSQCLGEEINPLVLFRDNVIKLRVEHSDDIAGLIVDMISSSAFPPREIEDVPHY